MTDPGKSEVDGFEYGALGDLSTDYQPISKNCFKSFPFSEYKHAAHGMIFAKKDQLLWNLYNTRAMLMMQMRFDGVIGFPGGLVDEGEDPLVGLNREMQEEIGLDVSQDKFEDEHYLSTHVHEGKKLVLHFYMKEVMPETFCSLEKKTLSALEYGVETQGTIRVPLFTMGDGIRGFPAFLANQFAGNAKDQLIHGLVDAKILSAEEVKKAVQTSKNLLTAV